MEFSVSQILLQQALTKIKNSIQNPSFIKLKASKNLIIATAQDGYSIVVKLHDFKIQGEGNATLDYEAFSQIVKGGGEINFKGDSDKVDFQYGKCKGSINLIEEIQFEHKIAQSLLDLDSDSTIIFDFLDTLTLKDIKFGQDDAPISIDIESKNKKVELSSATHSEAVLLEKKLKSKSDLSTALSPKVLKRVKGIVGKSSYKMSLTDSTLFIEFSDKNMTITFISPLPDYDVTSTENIKYLKRKELDKSTNYITIDSKDLTDYFSKLKAIVEPNNSVEMIVTKKGLSVSFTTSKGRVTDVLPLAYKKYKTDDKTFLIDYDLMLNNLSKFNGKLLFTFCSRALWIEVDRDETKIFIMVALL